MKRTSHGLLTGMDYSLEPRRRDSRRPRAALALLAISAFGLAWSLNGEAEPEVQAAAPTVAPLAAAPQLVPAPAIVPVKPAAHLASAAPSSPFIAERPALPAVAAPVIQKVAVARTVAPEARSEELRALREVPGVTSPSPLQAAQEAEPALEPSADKPESIVQLPKGLRLQSSVVLVVDQRTNEVLAGKNADSVRPIASLTKLMTALVVMEARQPLDEVLEITRDDIDREKNSHSRLSVGLKLTREDLLVLALMSSENRAASALGRHYPGGRVAFVDAMNRRARALGMTETHFADSTGLSDRNVSNAHDLVRLMKAAYEVPLIREFSTQSEGTFKPGRQQMHYVSSNRLVRAKNDWRIGLQKTGFTNAAGRCLVMQATVKGRPLLMVLLDSDGKLTRFADANRLRQWLETGSTGSSTKKARRSKKSAQSGGTRRHDAS